MRLLHTTKIERKAKITGKGLASSWQTVNEDVPCLVIPASTSSTLHEHAIIGKDYSAYFMIGADVEEGDKLTTSTGKTLLVNGVAKYDQFPRVSHIATTCTTAGNN